MRETDQADVAALRVAVEGVVQGVGFRPFVYRLAHRHALRGWVLNGEDGVLVHVEGEAARLRAFVDELQTRPPPAARITRLDVQPAPPEGGDDFSIRASTRRARPTVRISPDLCVCDDCLAELHDPDDRRSGYPYINCTNCGPRFSIIEALPYDRPHTTMRAWPMCPDCAREYEDPLDRRFHAQPTACPVCGPHYVLQSDEGEVRGPEAVEWTARMLAAGKIVAMKGLGGYHLACDAQNEQAVQALRGRKFRKEKPFAVMAHDLATARRLVAVAPEAEALLTSVARPIVLLPRLDGASGDVGATSRSPVRGMSMQGVAPGNAELGVILPYTPLHVLLFEHGAPDVLVMTSANRSSEPIAYRDDDALERLAGLADAFLIGERPIARRVDDSVVRLEDGRPMVLRRARGYAPGVVARLPTERPVLAVGADLKNAVTLVVNGEALVSQYVGDLDHVDVQEAFEQTVDDLTTMYDVPLGEALIVHDAHPQYRSTRLAASLAGERRAVQHHRAHVASVLAEHEAWTQTVVGFSFDGTGYGDDGTTWGGEVFVGSLHDGLERVGHLRPAHLPGGDAAARHPVQAAAGFLAHLPERPDLTAAPFDFPPRFEWALQLVDKGFRAPVTTSMGRLFDAVAALLGFTREMTFEGQAAIWLEQLARQAPEVEPYPFPDLDYRPLLQTVIEERQRGRAEAEVARAFHAGVAVEVVRLGSQFARRYGAAALVASGGVFQNALLLREMRAHLSRTEDGLPLWLNRRVPPNDGGISLGQAALAVGGG